MKNILDEKPTTDLFGRLRFTLSFVKKEDIENKEILDIGCGFGWFENFLLGHPVKKIYGVEYDKKILDQTRSRFEDPRLIFFDGSATSIPLKDYSVDTVCSWEVIEHIPKNSEDKMFKEVSRVLRKDGTFYLSTPFDSFLSKYLDPAWWLVGHRHYSINDLKKYAELNGFELIDYKILGGFWSLLSLLNLYFSKWVLRRRPIFQDFFTDKVDLEYNSNSDGLFNVFARFRKIG